MTRTAPLVAAAVVACVLLALAADVRAQDTPLCTQGRVADTRGGVEGSLDCYYSDRDSKWWCGFIEAWDHYHEDFLSEYGVWTHYISSSDGGATWDPVAYADEMYLKLPPTATYETPVSGNIFLVREKESFGEYDGYIQVMMYFTLGDFDVEPPQYQQSLYSVFFYNDPAESRPEPDIDFVGYYPMDEPQSSTSYAEIGSTQIFVFSSEDSVHTMFSVDEGESYSTPELVNYADDAPSLRANNATWERYPSIGCTDSKCLLVFLAGTGEDGLAHIIHMSTTNAVVWSSMEKLLPNPGEFPNGRNVTRPFIVGMQSEFMVSYSNTNTSDNYYTLSSSGGTVWAEGSPIDTMKIGCQPYQPAHIAYDADGDRVVAVWVNEPELDVVYYSVYTGGAWQTAFSTDVEDLVDEAIYKPTCKAFTGNGQLLAGCNLDLYPDSADDILEEGVMINLQCQTLTAELDTQCPEDACNPTACVNGMCEIEPDGVSTTCSCFDGWTRANCDHVIDECNAAPGETDVCWWHGSCFIYDTSSLQGAICTCEDGWLGDHCEFEDPCVAENPCLNDGVCTSKVDGTFTCSCADGYSGDDCSTEPSESTNLGVVIGGSIGGALFCFACVVAGVAGVKAYKQSRQHFDQELTEEAAIVAEQNARLAYLKKSDKEKAADRQQGIIKKMREERARAEAEKKAKKKKARSQSSFASAGSVSSAGSAGSTASEPYNETSYASESGASDSGAEQPYDIDLNASIDDGESGVSFSS